MILEIYTDSDVSKQDKHKCKGDYYSDEFGQYTIIGHYYVVYKFVSRNTVENVIKILYEGAMNIKYKV